MSELSSIALKIISKGKGILAADESTGTMTKRLKSVNVSSSPENKGKDKDINEIDNNEMILDIGPKTFSLIEAIINNSNTVLWNGPAGYFENPNFQNGTKQILEIISQKTKNDKIFSVAGGGETVAAIKKFKKLDSFTFVSTAGGAFLEHLEGKTLPGIKALNQNVWIKQYSFKNYW